MRDEVATLATAVQPMESFGLVDRPKHVISLATEAAKQLQDIVANKKDGVKINGQRYLEFEDWQTLGGFYGLFVSTGESEPVEIGGIKGAKGKAVVRDRRGTILGGAEAYCLRDEPNWKEKPWFQLASMAQTRAGSKALRNMVSWVVVLAGYKPTPAEEMAAQASGGTIDQTWRQLVSRFPNRCQGCGETIAKGQNVFYHAETKKVRCVNCPPVVVPADATPEPSDAGTAG